MFQNLNMMNCSQSSKCTLCLMLKRKMFSPDCSITFIGISHCIIILIKYSARSFGFKNKSVIHIQSSWELILIRMKAKKLQDELKIYFEPISLKAARTYPERHIFRVYQAFGEPINHDCEERMFYLKFENIITSSLCYSPTVGLIHFAFIVKAFTKYTKNRLKLIPVHGISYQHQIFTP